MNADEDLTSALGSSHSFTALVNSSYPLISSLQLFRRLEEGGWLDTNEVANQHDFFHFSMVQYFVGVMERLTFPEEKKSEQHLAEVDHKKRKMEETVMNPIIYALEEEKVSTSKSSKADGTDSPIFAQLNTYHANWLWDALSQCNSNVCKHAKISFTRAWIQTLEILPSHRRKNQYQERIALFDPENARQKLIQRPLNEKVLGGLWLRFFGHGHPMYLERIIDQGIEIYDVIREIQNTLPSLKAQIDELETKLLDHSHSQEQNQASPSLTQTLEHKRASYIELQHKVTHQQFLLDLIAESLSSYSKEHPLVLQTLKNTWFNHPKHPFILKLVEFPALKID